MCVRQSKQSRATGKAIDNQSAFSSAALELWRHGRGDSGSLPKRAGTRREAAGGSRARRSQGEGSQRARVPTAECRRARRARCGKGGVRAVSGGGPHLKPSLPECGMGRRVKRGPSGNPPDDVARAASGILGPSVGPLPPSLAPPARTCAGSMSARSRRRCCCCCTVRRRRPSGPAARGGSRRAAATASAARARRPTTAPLTAQA